MANSLQDTSFLFIFAVVYSDYCLHGAETVNAVCTKHRGFSGVRRTRRGDTRARQGQDSKNVKICEGVLYAERRRVGSSAKCSQSRTPRATPTLFLFSYTDVTRDSNVAYAT